MNLTTKKRKKKTTGIPLKLQIPAAIVLGIVFICVLNARLRGRGTAADTADEVATEEVTDAGSQPRVNALISTISEEEPESELEHASMPVLPSDPFAEPESPPARVGVGESAAQGRAKKQDAYSEAERARFLENLTLQATMVDGGARFAFIDGVLFVENDTIGAFKIVEIGERAACLDDGHGAVVLKMKGDDLL